VALVDHVATDGLPLDDLVRDYRECLYAAGKALLDDLRSATK
jgi:hypothetical protein